MRSATCRASSRFGIGTDVDAIEPARFAHLGLHLRSGEFALHAGEEVLRIAEIGEGAELHGEAAGLRADRSGRLLREAGRRGRRAGAPSGRRRLRQRAGRDRRQRRRRRPSSLSPGMIASTSTSPLPLPAMSEPVRGGIGQVDDAPVQEGSAVVHPHHHAACPMPTLVTRT